MLSTLKLNIFGIIVFILTMKYDKIFLIGSIIISRFNWFYRTMAYDVQTFEKSLPTRKTKQKQKTSHIYKNK